ncbi:helix-turn-helix domain-containing protein [Flavilitoribacter nigricans]|uniref:HTH araC/xylS-type domain-containing protein n=1 Tax=Flavilitoribacter nigricans (strain ATCC 23147 / DSM 23189 / NBRC 102662 / NCIMB 1420 / SS-2) TaxID=1122177 RepID=A0A2D0N8E6_FLAN2|nr:AraC family transcriptional regulator [Flavilitoribacter nigricans]PHN04660.1 hypothetical protein CRP01_19265 [Flavilitoribacter nigricans DSM 23189 = NBRC 102662]
MNYTYHRDCHELWANDTPGYSPPFHIHHPPAAGYGIEHIFIISNPDLIPTPVVILPDLCGHLIVHVFTDGRTRLRIIGPRTRALFINRQQRQRTYVIRFQPTALANYLPFPVDELTDRSLAFNELNGAGRQELSYGNWLVDKPATIIESLLAQLSVLGSRRPASPRSMQVQRFLQVQTVGDPPLKVSAIARQIGLSERYLQRIVRNQTGISPKMALRILRFRESLQIRQAYRRLSWSAIADTAGYFDQSHMIDEYQRFLGASPEQFFYGQ